MAFHRIPTQEPFFKLDENQQVQRYLSAVKRHEEPKHLEIMRLVRERIHPPAVEEEGALAKVGSFFSSFTGGVQKAAGKVKSAAGKLKLGHIAMSYLEAPLSEKEQEMYLKKRKWIMELRNEAAENNDNVTIERLEKLQILLEADRSRVVKTIIERLATLGEERIFPQKYLADIQHGIQEGDFNGIREAIQFALKQTSGDEEKAEEAQMLLSDLKQILEVATNPVEQWTEQVVAHDIAQLIKHSPLDALYQLKSEFENNPSEQAWFATLGEFRESLQETAGQHAETLKLLDEIENAGTREKYEDAIRLTDQMIKGMMHSLFSVAGTCVKMGCAEIGETIVQEDFQDSQQELQAQIMDALQNGRNAQANVRIRELAQSVELAPEEKAFIQVLERHLSHDTTQVLFEALNRIAQSKDTEAHIKVAAKDLREYVEMDTKSKQLIVVRSVIPHVKSQVNGDLVNAAVTLRQMERNRGLSAEAISRVIETSSEGIQERLQVFLQEFQAIQPPSSRESFKLIAALEREGRRDHAVALLEGLQEQIQSDIKGVYGVVKQTMQEIAVAEASDIPNILSDALAEILEKESRGYMKERVEQFRREAGSQFKLSQLEELRQALPEEQQPLVKAVMLHVTEREEVAKAQLQGLIAQTDDEGQKVLFQQMYGVLNEPQSTLWTDVLDVVAGLIGGEDVDAESSMAELAEKLVREKGSQVILNELDRRIALRRQEENEETLETVILEMLKGIVANSAEDVSAPLKEALEALAIKQIKPYSLKRLAEFKENIETPREQAEELQRRINAAGDKIGETARQGLAQVKAALEVGNRKGANALMESEVMRAVLYEPANPEQLAELEFLKRFVEKDTRQISEHFSDCLTAIIEGNGKQIQEPLMEMLSTVAKQQGPTILREQMEAIRGKAVMQGKAAAIDELIKVDPGKYHSHRAAIEGIRIDLIAGNQRAAEQKGAALPEILEIVQRPESSLPIAIIDTLCAALSDQDTQEAADGVYAEMRRQMNTVMNEGKKAMVTQLSHRLEAVQEGEETMETLVLKMLKGVVENSQEDVNTPMQEFFQDLARNEVKPYVLGHLTRFQESIELPQALADALGVMIEGAEDRLSDSTKERLAGVQEALNQGDRTTAKRLMQDVLHHVLFEETGREQLELLQQMQQVVERDEREIGQHLSATLAAIIEGDGQQIQEPLIEMISTIAKQQGPGMVRAQLEGIRERVALQGVVADLDREIYESGPALAFKKEEVEAVRTAFLKGDRDRAREIASNLPERAEFARVKSIALQERTGLPLALIDTLCAALAGDDIEIPSEQLFKEFQKQAKEWIRVGQQKMITRLEVRLEAALGRGEEGLLEAQAIRAALAGLGATEEGMTGPLKELFKTLAKKEGKPWALQQIEEMREGIERPTLRPNLEQLNAYFEGLEEEPGESILQGRAGIEDALAQNDRGLALERLAELEREVVFQPVSSTEGRRTKARDLKILRNMRPVLEKDHAGLTLHVIDALEAIVENEGDSLSEHLTKMVTLIAKNEGRDVLTNQLEHLKAQAELEAKAKTIEKAVMRSTNDLHEISPTIVAILEHVHKGEVEEALEAYEAIADRSFPVCEKIRSILETPQADLQVRLLEAFGALVSGQDAEDSLMQAFDAVKSHSDRMLFQQIADYLEESDEHGLERLFAQYMDQSRDAESGSVPMHLRRIFEFFVSAKGKAAVGNVVARQVLERVMGEELPAGDLEVDQDLFNQRMNALVDRFLNPEVVQEEEVAPQSGLPAVLRSFGSWISSGGGLEKLAEGQIFGPILEKVLAAEEVGESGQEALLTEWLASTDALQPRNPMPNKEALQRRFLSKEGFAAFAKVVMRRHAKQVNGEVEIPRREVIETRRTELTEQLNQLGEGPQKMCDAIIKLVLKEIGEVTSQELKAGETVLDVGEFVVQQETLESAQTIHFAKIGPVVLTMNRDDFKLALEVAVKQALLEGKGVIDAASTGKSGYDFVCDLATNACEAMNEHLDNPEARFDWDDSKMAKELANKLFGHKMERLGFTPFVQQVVGELLAPSAAGGAPFRIFGAKPIGSSIVEQLYRGEMYKDLYDDVLANVLKDKVDELTKTGNLYDYIFKRKKGKTEELELSEQEERFRDEVGELALNLYKQIDPYWAAEMDAFAQEEKFKKGIGDVMLPAIREYLCEELKQEAGDHQEITTDMLYEYALRKGAETLENVAKAKKSTKAEKKQKQEEAIRNVGHLAQFAEPILKHKSFAGLIIGAIGHFLAKITIDPIIALIGWIVKAICKRTKKPFNKTLWYQLTEGRKEAHAKRKGEAIYKPIRDLVQTDRLWQRTFDRVIKERVLSPEKD